MTVPPYLSEYQAGYIHVPGAGGVVKVRREAGMTPCPVQNCALAAGHDKSHVDKNGLKFVRIEIFKEEQRVVDPETGGEKGMKPERHSLIPVRALGVVARVYHYGSQKYAAHNWRKGYSWSLSFDACRRHLDAFWDGEDNDPESGLPHLAHAAFHVFTMLTFLLDPRYAGKDDRYKP